MNEPENNIPSGADSPERRAIIELKKALVAMRVMFHLMALCSLMLTGTIFVLFYKQLSIVRKQVDDSLAYVQDYNTKFVPQIEIVRANLETYARTNESLLPLMRRYFSTNMAKGPVPASSTNR